MYILLYCLSQFFLAIMHISCENIGKYFSNATVQLLSLTCPVMYSCNSIFGEKTALSLFFPFFFSRTDFTSHSLLPRCPHTFDPSSLLYLLLAKQCSHSHADNFFLTSCPWRWWSWSPSLPTLIWGAVTVKWELEVDKNYSLDLNRCNSFRWWEEGLNFAAAGILRHLCFLSKPFLLLRKPLLLNDDSR